MIIPGIVDSRRQAAGGAPGGAGAYNWLLNTAVIPPGSGISATGDGKEVENVSTLGATSDLVIPTFYRFDAQNEYVYFEIHVDRASYTGPEVDYTGKVGLVNSAQISNMIADNWQNSAHSYTSFWSYSIKGDGAQQSRFSQTFRGFLKHGKVEGLRSVIRLVYNPFLGQYWWLTTDGLDGDTNPYSASYDFYNPAGPDPRPADQPQLITSSFQDEHYRDFISFNVALAGERYRLVDDPPDMAFAVPSGCVAMSNIEPVPLFV